MSTIRTVSAHDWPDMCSLLAHVEDGRIVPIQGDPDPPFTAGFACGKVNRDMDLVYSPERLTTPLRRTGPKGSGQFEPISWDQALDEIVSRWRGIIAVSGPQAILGYAYSAHQGLMNRGLTRPMAFSGVVRLHNDNGQVPLRLKVSDKAHSGCAGPWPAP